MLQPIEHPPNVRLRVRHFRERCLLEAIAEKRGALIRALTQEAARDGHRLERNRK